MAVFLTNILSFPTVVFTAVLVFCLFYWLTVLLGVLDIDTFDLDVDAEGVDLGAAAGLFVRLNLHQVPLPIILTVFSLVGWFLSYYGVHFITRTMVDLPALLINTVILMGSIILSLLMTGWLTKPLRPIFSATFEQHKKDIIGHIGIVRTSSVTAEFGEAEVNDGGAGLIVRVRAYTDANYSRGDRVALIEYCESDNVYHVISEKEFKSK